MKLSKETLDTLKNFATINSNFYSTGSKTISTKTVSRQVYVEAEIEEQLPQAFGIYNLSEFLGAVSMFSEPEVEFCDTYAQIQQGYNSIKYVFSDPEVLDFPKKQLSMPSCDIEFQLSEENIKALIKASSVLSLVDILIEGDGSRIKCSTVNVQNPSSNAFSIDVGETSSTFKAYLKVENLRLILSGIYTVSISKQKIAKFARHDGKYNFYVALVSTSEFN